MQVPFRQGIVKSTPNFLQVTGSTVSLVVPAPEYILITVADQTTDYLITERRSVPNAWTGPFTTDGIYWLYWDIHPLTGAKTYGHTTYEPIEGSTAPTQPVNDQHWFDTTSNTMKVWNAAAGRWVNKIRVFAAKLIGGSTLISMSISSPAFEGTQVGTYVGSPILAGYLVFDDEGKALRKGNGKFFTTEDVSITGITSSARVRLGSIVKEAEAMANMANNTVVVFSDFDKIRPAEPSDFVRTKQFGIIEEDVIIGDFVNVITDGVVSSVDWDWTPHGVNTPLYVGAGGVLSVTPTAPALAPIAIVIGQNSIQLGALEVNVIVSGTAVEAMTPTTAGVARLSVAADSLHDPIVVGDNDPRLSDARVPVDHSHAIADVVGLQAELGSMLRLSGGTMTGVLTLNGDPVGELDAATKQYVDARVPVDIVDHTHAIADVVGLQGELDSMLRLSGGMMTGALTLSGDPVEMFDAVPKHYVDARVDILQAELDNTLRLSGGTMTGALTLSGDPVNDFDAATKQYVDNMATGTANSMAPLVGHTFDYVATTQGVYGVSLLPSATTARVSTDGLSKTPVFSLQTAAYDGGSLGYAIDFTTTASSGIGYNVMYAVFDEAETWSNTFVDPWSSFVRNNPPGTGIPVGSHDDGFMDLQQMMIRLPASTPAASIVRLSSSAGPITVSSPTGLEPDTTYTFVVVYHDEFWNQTEVQTFDINGSDANTFGDLVTALNVSFEASENQGVVPPRCTWNFGNTIVVASSLEYHRHLGVDLASSTAMTTIAAYYGASWSEVQVSATGPTSTDGYSNNTDSGASGLAWVVPIEPSPPLIPGVFAIG